ncbi:MAG: hypothetical protein AAB355_02255 [Patescibacteria group bacterium]
MESHIKNFFDKFLKLKNNNLLLKKEIIESIFINTGIMLKKEQIEINKKNISINTSSIIKNEIFIKKREIVDYFFKKTKRNISNINWN